MGHDPPGRAGRALLFHCLCPSFGGRLRFFPGQAFFGASAFCILDFGGSLRLGDGSLENLGSRGSERSGSGFLQSLFWLEQLLVVGPHLAFGLVGAGGGQKAHLGTGDRGGASVDRLGGGGFALVCPLGFDDGDGAIGVSDSEVKSNLSFLAGVGGGGSDLFNSAEDEVFGDHLGREGQDESGGIVGGVAA